MEKLEVLFENEVFYLYFNNKESEWMGYLVNNNRNISVCFLLSFHSLVIFLNEYKYFLIRKKKRFTETLNKFVIRAEFYFQLRVSVMLKNFISLWCKTCGH